MTAEKKTVLLAEYKEDPNQFADFLLLDVREQDEWDEGYIPGATHLALGLVPVKMEEVEPNKDKGILVYCHSGGRAGRAATQLRAMGYTNVKSMKGGWCEWTDFAHCNGGIPEACPVPQKK